MRKIKLANAERGDGGTATRRPVTVIDWEYHEIPFGQAESALKQIEACADEILKEGGTPFLLGCEHLLMLGALRAVYRNYPNVCVIHFDARADLREKFLGEKLAHACVMRRCWELTGSGRIYQFGIRRINRDEARWAPEHVSMQRRSFLGLEQTLERLKGIPVYLTIDLDILDPTLFPGAQQPEPGGITLQELIRHACLVCEKAQVVGCDVCELSKCCDSSGVSSNMIKSLVQEMLR